MAGGVELRSPWPAGSSSPPWPAGRAPLPLADGVELPLAGGVELPIASGVELPMAGWVELCSHGRQRTTASMTTPVPRDRCAAVGGGRGACGRGGRSRRTAAGTSSRGWKRRFCCASRGGGWTAAWRGRADRSGDGEILLPGEILLVVYWIPVHVKAKGNLSMAHYENLVLCYTHHQRDFSFHHTTKMRFGLQHTTSNKQIIFSKEEV